MVDVEVVLRYMEYDRSLDRVRVEDRNIANRIFGIPRDQWVKYRPERHNDMHAMQPRSGG